MHAGEKPDSVYQKDPLTISSVNFVLRVYQGMRSKYVLTAYIAFTNEVPLLLPHQVSQLSHFAPKWTPFILYILIPYSLVRKTILGLPPSMVLINLENKIFLGAKITGLVRSGHFELYNLDFDNLYFTLSYKPLRIIWWHAMKFYEMSWHIMITRTHRRDWFYILTVVSDIPWNIMKHIMITRTHRQHRFYILTVVSDIP